jgi:DNA-binding LytR/AlgR family response regulator
MDQTDILLPNGRNWDLVPISTIRYIEANRKLCKVVTATREYCISRSLQSLEAHLPKMQFLRIHKSYIVAIGYVNTIGKAELHIAGRALPVSRVVIPELYRRFPKFG